MGLPEISRNKICIMGLAKKESVRDALNNSYVDKGTMGIPQSDLE